MPKLLDLFCGGGGASMGYHDAGYEVTGVDLKAQPDYPFTFIQADAMEILADLDFLNQFDVIHASPPCQVFTRARHLMKAQGNSTDKPDLVEAVRAALIAWGGTYVIENVPDAPMNGITLCGSSFDLKVRRHRIFESNVVIPELPHYHKEQGKPVGVYGAMGDQPQGEDKATGKYVYGGTVAKTLVEAQAAMGIHWLKWQQLKESIPPAYTHYIGQQLSTEVIHRVHNT
jgi:DNA (cytosine-5)-methyltransferase 1